MIPAAFDYVRAGSAAEAIALIGEHGEDAKFLAGGMSLLPLMKLRLATPSVLVDVGRVRDLSYVRDAGDHLAIGALTRHRDLETNDLLAKECGVLRAVAAQVEGVFQPYFKAVYHHMWEEPKKMDDPAVVREALISSGIDADKIIARSQDPEVKNKLMELTQNAVERGAFGSPTFFVGNEMFFGKDQLRDVEEEIVAQKSGARRSA